MSRIAVFASGRGSNFRSVYQNIKNQYLAAEIVLLISDNKAAKAIDFAETNGINVSVVEPKQYSSSKSFGETLLQVLELHNVDLVILAGYLKKIPAEVVDRFPNRILNIHPALLPAFAGKGMYGINVHKAVYQAGVKVSGVTVHFVNNEYDMGAIIAQKAINIEDCHSAEEIAQKILLCEHQLLPKAVKLILEHEFSVIGRRVTIGKRKK